MKEVLGLRGVQVPSFDITPTMRKSALSQGQPMYQLKPGQSRFDALKEVLERLNAEDAAAKEKSTAKEPELELPEWEPPRHPEEAAEEAQLPDDLTGIKKAVVNDLRALVGLPEMEGSTPQSVEEWAEFARMTLAADPKAAIRLVNELSTNPRAISQHDAMLLQFRYRQLANELEPAVDEYIEAVKSKDPVAIATARTEVQNRRIAMTAFEEVIHPSKETWGRTGVALQQMLRKDFSLEAILRRGQESNHGEELTPEQTVELTKMAKDLENLQKRFDEQQRTVLELEQELASVAQHQEVVKDTKRRRTRAKPKEKQAAETRRKAAWSNFKDKWAALGHVGAVYDPKAEAKKQAELLDAAVELAKAYAAEGFVRFKEFWASIKPNIKDADQAEGVFRTAWDQVATEEEVVTPELDMGDLPGLSKDARRIQRLLVESGITDRDEVIDMVHEIMSEELPDFTRRQTMDALSRYGQFQTQSQDEIDKLLRDMNAEVLKLSQLDQLDIAMKRVEELRQQGLTDEEIGNKLVQENLLVKATGLVRDKPTETVRHLTTKYNELKKGIPASTEGRAGMLQTAVAAIERALTNRIRDLNWDIAHPDDRIIRERKASPTNETIEQLRKERDRLLKIHREMFPPQRKKMTPEQKLANAIKAAERSIAAIEKQLETRNFDRPQREKLDSPELSAVRARLEQLRAQRDAAKALELAQWEGEGGALAPDPKEAAYRKAYMASLRKRIANFQTILAEGDFAPKPKKEPRKLSQSELKLKREMEDIRHQVLQKYAEYHLAHLTGIAWTADKIAETAHLSRAMMTSFDLSALLRQGGLPAMGHPVLAKRALLETVASIAHTFDGKNAQALRDGVTLENVKKFLKTIDSRQAEFDFMHKLTQGTEGEFRLQAGLSLPSTDEAITKQEEVFQGRWGQYVPGVAVSSRLYTMILNKMRADLFDLMVQNLGRNGQVTIDEAKVIAGFVNVATGRTSFGEKGNKLAAAANIVFFAPRYVASRFQYLAMPFYLPFKGGIKQNWRVKRAIYKEYGRTAAGIATVLGAFALAAQLFWDDEDEDKPTIETDARSADFLKVRMGETRLDFLAGLSQAMVLSQRLAPEWLGGGATKSSVTGEVRKFGEGYNPQTRGTVLARVARTKLAPVPGFIVTGLNDWENVVGQKKDRLLGYNVHPAVGSAAEMFFPLSVRDVAETMEAQGLPATAAMSLLAILGVGMNTYGPKTEYATATPKEREKLLEKYIDNITWKDGLPAYSEFLTQKQTDLVEARLKNRKGSVVNEATMPKPKQGKKKSDEDHQKSLDQWEKARERFREMVATLGLNKSEALKLLQAYWTDTHGGYRKDAHTLQTGYLAHSIALTNLYKE
jgi:hypothetical protein